MVYASPGTGLTRVYKLGARAGKYKIGARAGGQAEDRVLGNTNTHSTNQLLMIIISLFVM